MRYAALKRLHAQMLARLLAVWLRFKSPVALVAAALVMLCAPVAGCAGTQSIDVDWSEQLEVEGELRCEGRGVVRIARLVELGVEGNARAGGTVDAGGESEGVAACAGVTLFAGPWRWSWYDTTQQEGVCLGLAGRVVLEKDPAWSAPEEEVEPAPGGL